MANQVFLLIVITSFLIIATIPSSTFGLELAATSNAEDDDEYLSFLEEEGKSESETHGHHHGGVGSHDEFDDHFDGNEEEESVDGNFENYDDFDETEFNQEGQSEQHEMPVVDEKDVVVLKEKNFGDVIENNRFVRVEFYALSCGHCQASAPEYAAAATELKE